MTRRSDSSFTLMEFLFKTSVDMDFPSEHVWQMPGVLAAANAGKYATTVAPLRVKGYPRTSSTDRAQFAITRRLCHGFSSPTAKAPFGA